MPPIWVDPRFNKGLELFNKRHYFECHEVLEDLWLSTPSEDRWRDLYKGVIQAAASLYQHDRGIFSGAKGLYRTSVEYLEKYTDDSLGLNVRKLIDEMNAFYKDPAKAQKPVLDYGP